MRRTNFFLIVYVTVTACVNKFILIMGSSEAYSESMKMEHVHT